MLRDPASDYFLSPDDYKSTGERDEAIRQELEERDYYIEKNVFWVPALARWKTLQDSAKLPAGTEITVTNGKTSTYKITSTGKLIDDALEAISDLYLPIPDVAEIVQPLLAVVPLQLLAYHVALLRGCDIDKPRNLAKSVTVE